MKHIFRRILCVRWAVMGFVMAQLGGLPSPAVAAPQGLKGLLVECQTAPGHRTALRQALLSTTRARLQLLQRTGVVDSYRLLFSRSADSDRWDALVLILFKDQPSGAAWPALERELPSGLGGPALALATKVHAVPVEMLRQPQAEAPGVRPVVLAIPYQSLVSSQDYLTYVDGYLMPQFGGWIREGMISRVSLFGAAFPAGRPWSHQLLFDYSSDEALAARAAVVAKVRSQLKEQPAWRAFSENRSKVREEGRAVVADDISDEQVAP